MTTYRDAGCDECGQRIGHWRIADGSAPEWELLCDDCYEDEPDD